jgi:hypothetical protein
MAERFDLLRARIVEAAVLAPTEEQKATIRAMERSLTNVVHWDGWILFDMEGDRSFLDSLSSGKRAFDAASNSLKHLELLTTGIEPDVGLDEPPSITQQG